MAIQIEQRRGVIDEGITWFKGLKGVVREVRC
jgi:hypothetical protein